MPPIRTAKKTQSAAASAALPSRTGPHPFAPIEALETVDLTTDDSAVPCIPEGPKKKSTKQPALKGDKEVNFIFDRNGFDGRFQRVIGTTTRKITFDYKFILKDDHIDSIITLGPHVCEKFFEFIVNYTDVSYDAHNGANEVTEEAVVRLAQACPNLRKVQLQGVKLPSDAALQAFFDNCPHLTTVDITGGSRYGPTFSHRPLDYLRENSELAPKLRKLILAGPTGNSNTKFIKAGRELTKSREILRFILVERSEFKSHGDWELSTSANSFRRGKKEKGYPKTDEFREKWYGRTGPLY